MSQNMYMYVTNLLNINIHRQMSFITTWIVLQMKAVVQALLKKQIFKQ